MRGRESFISGVDRAGSGEGIELGLDGRGLDDGVQVGPHGHLVYAVVRALAAVAAGGSGGAPDLRDDPPERADALQGVVRILASHPLANLIDKIGYYDQLVLAFSKWD